MRFLVQDDAHVVGVGHGVQRKAATRQARPTAHLGARLSGGRLARRGERDDREGERRRRGWLHAAERGDDVRLSAEGDWRAVQLTREAHRLCDGRRPSRLGRAGVRRERARPVRRDEPAEDRRPGQRHKLARRANAPHLLQQQRLRPMRRPARHHKQLAHARAEGARETVCSDRAVRMGEQHHRPSAPRRLLHLSGEGGDVLVKGLARRVRGVVIEDE
mmetsp:Transcript_18932/g.56080  ORF Transcript_18932/g.56080 Transcript_18932/m.56080 type:complete len:218 (+) Transcript_18932:194-847(+)